MTTPKPVSFIIAAFLSQTMHGARMKLVTSNDDTEHSNDGTELKAATPEDKLRAAGVVDCSHTKPGEICDACKKSPGSVCMSMYTTKTNEAKACGKCHEGCKSPQCTGSCLHKAFDLYAYSHKFGIYNQECPAPRAEDQEEDTSTPVSRTEDKEEDTSTPVPRTEDKEDDSSTPEDKLKAAGVVDCSHTKPGEICDACKKSPGSVCMTMYTTKTNEAKACGKCHEGCKSPQCTGSCLHKAFDLYAYSHKFGIYNQECPEPRAEDKEEDTPTPAPPSTPEDKLRAAGVVDCSHTKPGEICDACKQSPGSVCMTMYTTKTSDAKACGKCHEGCKLPQCTGSCLHKAFDVYAYSYRYGPYNQECPA